MLSQSEYRVGLRVSLQEIEARYKAFCDASGMTVVGQTQAVHAILHDILALRTNAQTVQEKQDLSLFLENMFVYFDQSKTLSNVVKAMFCKLIPKSATGIFIPALVFSGYYTHGSTPNFSLFGLDQRDSYQLCLKLHCFRAVADNLELSAEFFLYDVKRLLQKDLDEPTGPEAHARYKAFVAFLYQCFDQVYFPQPGIAALENELSKSLVFFADYAKQERDWRIQPVISRYDLAASLFDYKSESWLGWFWNTLLCGAFGRHESYTIAALKQLLTESKTHYTEDDIKTKLEVEPKHLAHRLRFFEPLGIAQTTSGTDEVLVDIKSRFAPYC